MLTGFAKCVRVDHNFDIQIVSKSVIWDHKSPLGTMTFQNARQQCNASLLLGST